MPILSAEALSDLSINDNDNKKEFLDWWDFSLKMLLPFLLKLGHKSSLFRQGFTQNLIISSTQLREHLNFDLNTEEGLPLLETKN